MTTSAVHNLVSQARMRMLLQDFFFGRLALYLDLKEDPSLPTLATDGKSIFYNPRHMQSLTVEQRMAEIAHEVAHCALQHFARRGARDGHRWNIAADYAANLLLKDAGYRIGADWLIDEKYRDKTAEQIYDLLPSDVSKLKPQCRLIDSQKSIDDAMSAQWQVAVQAAAIDAAKHNAKLPASIQRLIDEVRHPPVPWREVLRRWMCEKINDDYSWARPNRKYVGHGLYLPAVHNEGMGTLGVVVDTSGSITPDIFQNFIGAIQDIVNQAQPQSIVYMAADAEVHETVVFERQQLDVKQLHATGGGGTDFRPALTAMEAHFPVALIYLTDLYGSYDEPPSYPVLWACISDEVARWGETIHIKA